MVSEDKERRSIGGAICSALVLPGKDEILLGVMPLEDMDLNVNPGKGCLEGAHGDYWVRYVR